jgi:hypothetical protein
VETVPVTDVVFPRTATGERSSSALGRAVVAEAMQAADPAAAEAVRREQDWRPAARRRLP